MTYHLGLLDKSPIPQGDTPEGSLARTVALAQRAEALGYHRFWVAEHHGFAGLAGSVPEVLAAYLLARTQRIRIGTAGVLLQHYSPYKVAEAFHLLAALAPGRIDLGIGKAPGGFPSASRALRHGRSATVFADDLALLGRFIDGDVPKGHLFAGAVATPAPRVPPERFLLGASPDSALLAAEHGWTFVFAGQLNGDQQATTDALDAYRRASGGRAPVLALAALAARTGAETERQAASLKVLRVTLDTGQCVNLGTAEQAAEFARQAGAASYTAEERRPNVIAGTATQVHRQLADLARRHGIEEFILDTPVATGPERFASIELLAAEQPTAVAA